MRPDSSTLRLHEELLLLALRDEKGTIHSRAGMYHYALAGGMLAELLLADRIEVQEEKRKKKYVIAVDESPIGDALLDEALERIATAKRRATIETWVGRLAQTKQLRHRIAQELCRKRVLREDEDRILWLFRRQLYPERDGRVERRIVERLRKAIFGASRQVEPRTAMLVALADGVGLLTIPFEKRELKERKERIKELAEGNAVGAATRAAVQAVQAAMIAAAAASSVAVTAATSG